MSGPPHGFQSNFNVQQAAMRNQFMAGGGQQIPGLMNQQAAMVSQQSYGNVGVQQPMAQQQQMQMQQQQLQMQQQQHLQMQQQQQQQHHQQQQAIGSQMPNQQPPQQPQKEINVLTLCRAGQETVSDIVSRTQDVFNSLKVIQPPNGTAQGASLANDKKGKLADQFRFIKMMFKRLRLIYEKCNESCQLQGMEYMHIESLIPLKEEWDVKSEERKTSEYRVACEESKEIMEQVVLKNRQLKEVIENLRRIIWEINTMLAMRRS